MNNTEEYFGRQLIYENIQWAFFFLCLIVIAALYVWFFVLTPIVKKIEQFLKKKRNQ